MYCGFINSISVWHSPRSRAYLSSKIRQNQISQYVIWFSFSVIIECQWDPKNSFFIQNLSWITKNRHFMPQKTLKFDTGPNFYLLMFLSFWNKKNVKFIVYFGIWSMKIHFFTKKHCYMNDWFIWGTDMRNPNFTFMISFL